MQCEALTNLMAVRQVAGKSGAETSGWFYPREGDRILSLNYAVFRPPANWLGQQSAFLYVEQSGRVCVRAGVRAGGRAGVRASGCGRVCPQPPNQAAVFRPPTM